MTRLASNIEETSTSTGTGNLTLAGAVTNKKTFNAEYSTNKRFPYQINHADTDWEEGVGYLSAATTLVRETVKRSSNSDAAVNFGAGSKTITVDFISEMQFGFNTVTEAVVGSDVTVEIGASHELDINGMTADRNFDLPTGTKGDQIQIILTTDAHADHELVIRSGSTPTELTRLLIDGEVMTYRCVGGYVWSLVNDGRIPCTAEMHATSNQIISASTYEILSMDVIDESRGIKCNLTTEDMTVRRAGKYKVNMTVSINQSGSSASYISIAIDGNDTSFSITPSTFYTQNGPRHSSSREEFSAGEAISLLMFPGYSGTTRAETANQEPRLILTEKF